MIQNLQTPRSKSKTGNSDFIIISARVFRCSPYYKHVVKTAIVWCNMFGCHYLAFARYELPCPVTMN